MYRWRGLAGSGTLNTGPTESDAGVYVRQKMKGFVKNDFKGSLTRHSQNGATIHRDGKCLERSRFGSAENWNVVTFHVLSRLFLSPRDTGGRPQAGR